MYRKGQRRKLKRSVKVVLLASVLVVITFVFITIASSYENAAPQKGPHIEYGGVHKIPATSYVFKGEQGVMRIEVLWGEKIE